MVFKESPFRPSQIMATLAAKVGFFWNERPASRAFHFLSYSLRVDAHVLFDLTVHDKYNHASSCGEKRQENPAKQLERPFTQDKTDKAVVGIKIYSLQDREIQRWLDHPVF